MRTAIAQGARFAMGAVFGQRVADATIAGLRAAVRMESITRTEDALAGTEDAKRFTDCGCGLGEECPWRAHTDRMLAGAKMVIACAQAHEDIALAALNDRLHASMQAREEAAIYATAAPAQYWPPRVCAFCDRDLAGDPNAWVHDGGLFCSEAHARDYVTTRAAVSL